MSHKQWIDGKPGYIPGAEFDVLLNDGTTRTCKRISSLDWSNLFYTDCTHPAQNAFCADTNIKSWRVKG
jgi:hypothetical protein